MVLTFNLELVLLLDLISVSFVEPERVRQEVVGFTLIHEGVEKLFRHDMVLVESQHVAELAASFSLGPLAEHGSGNEERDGRDEGVFLVLVFFVGLEK